VPFLLRGGTNTADAGSVGDGSGLTTSALEAQQRKLTGPPSVKKRVSSLLGMGKKSTKSTQSADVRDKERKKERQKEREQERESFVEIGSKSSLLKVSVQRGQEVTTPRPFPSLPLLD
jgi:hypothetical protein